MRYPREVVVVVLEDVPPRGIPRGILVLVVVEEGALQEYALPVQRDAPRRIPRGVVVEEDALHDDVAVAALPVAAALVVRDYDALRRVVVVEVRRADARHDTVLVIHLVGLELAPLGSPVHVEEEQDCPRVYVYAVAHPPVEDVARIAVPVPVVGCRLAETPLLDVGGHCVRGVVRALGGYHRVDAVAPHAAGYCRDWDRHYDPHPTPRDMPQRLPTILARGVHLVHAVLPRVVAPRRFLRRTDAAALRAVNHLVAIHFALHGALVVAVAVVLFVA